MYMIGHQAISQHIDLMFLAIFFNPILIRMMIFIGEENIFKTSAAPSNVVWNSGEYISG